jgi:hypothetical protein
MKVRELRELLDAFNGESEVAIEATFPQLDFAVKAYSFAYGYDEGLGEEEGFQLSFDIYEADFDYPAVLRRVKDAVASIPEEYCSPN